MSEEEKPLEFSARDLMPDWAQEKPSEPQKDYAKRYAEDDDRRDRRGGKGGRRDDRRGGGGFGGGGQREDRRGGGFAGRGDSRGGGPRGPRPDRGGDRPRGDRREGDRRGGGDRRHGDRERNDRPREAQPAAGVVATLEPSGPAVEGLTRHIRETFRSFPVADLAKMILEARERYRIRFTATEPVRLNQCLLDGSLWLSREEAILHLLSGPALDHYYLAEDIEIDPPAGNFAVIAVCGMSGVILGPPNHHEYQRNIARLHRERFSDMPIERFKSRIRMESGEEILEKWKEQVSRVRQYRVKPLDQPSPVEEETVTVAEEAPAEEVAATDPEITAEETAPEVADEPAAEEIEAETEVAAEVEADAEAEAEEASEPASPAPAEKTDDGPVFKSLEEVSRHFREHFAGPIIVETSVAVVPGNIAGRLLSPGLLVHLRQETEKLRRGFPLAMIQSLCGEFERKGLKFFKRGKKSLHVSAVRPKPIDEGANFTESIQAIVEFVKTAPKPNVASLLEALVPGFKNPEGPAIEESPEWSDAARTVLKDLRWLTAEGYLLEFADTGLALGRQPQEASVAPAEAKTPKEKGAKPAKAKKDGGKPKAEAAVPAEAAVEEAMEEAPVSEEAAEEVSESVSEEVAEPASEEVSETISEEVSEPASEPVVDLETAPEELAESVADLSHEDESDPDEPRDGADPVATA